jgi:hypothetical protein
MFPPPRIKPGFKAKTGAAARMNQLKANEVPPTAGKARLDASLRASVRSDRSIVAFYREVEASGAGDVAVQHARGGRSKKGAALLTPGKCAGSCVAEDRCRNNADFRCGACCTSQPCTKCLEKERTAVLAATKRAHSKAPARGLSHAVKVADAGESCTFIMRNIHDSARMTSTYKVSFAIFN